MVLKSSAANSRHQSSDSDDLMICRCEEVLRKEILKAIHHGARTVNEVKKLTRAGMGLCQGKSCERHVRFILAEVTGQKLETIEPATTRPPVRPLPIFFLNDWVEP
ncbi:MAG: (2Fe-2S)-binding protein [Deltaproteobacteria bacterium]|nr:(2Fe-2S)-binding protein [Deltaproteobacteria bacterium]MBW2305391.1 (2Fe-2S)-binding protein [Deltaproteobacteria bacterium]